MGWFNYYGLAVMVVIMIPNIVYAVKHRSGVENTYKNKPVEVAEQIGRYACMLLMIFNIPYTYSGFWFGYALAVYLSVNGGLCLAYLIFWVICRNGNGKLKALSLSVIPTAVFLFSGIMLISVPLIASAVLFGIAHIFISVRSQQIKNGKERGE